MAATVSLTGQRLNALCIIYTDDHRLVGVAVDGSSLLSVAKGATSTVPVRGGPSATPSCLSGHGSLVWGPTSTARSR